MNHCDSGGWVVGNRPLPDDPSDYDLPRLPKLGCTRIRCGLCKQLVRSQGGVAMKQRGTKIDLVALYAVTDLATSPLFVRDAEDRFYFCHCAYHTESSQHPLDEPDGSMAIPVAQQWKCDGHPAVTLPHDFDGTAFTAENLVDQVHEALRGRLPPNARPEDKTRSFWLARLYGRLAGTPYAQVVERTAAGALDNPDLTVRMHALHLFQLVQSTEAARGALMLLQGDRATFVDVKDTMTAIPRDVTLEHALWRVAAPLVAQGPARELARREALAPGKGSKALYDALGAGDAEWLVAHATEIAQANPARADDLATTLKHKLAAGVDGSAAIAAIKKR